MSAQRTILTTTTCPVCGKDPFPLLIERDGQAYYVGPLEPAKDLLTWEVSSRGSDSPGLRLSYNDEGFWIVTDDDLGTWGSGPTEEEAWRWFAGVEFGPLDEEYDDTWLRRNLEGHTHVNYPHHPGSLYDCRACEARCYCDKAAVARGEQTECIWSGHEHQGITADGQSTGVHTVKAGQ